MKTRQFSCPAPFLQLRTDAADDVEPGFQTFVSPMELVTNLKCRQSRFLLEFAQGQRDGTAAARMAGGRPPMMPMSKAKMMPPTSSPGVIRKAKARWEKVCQFIAPVVRPFNGRTAIQPTTPPMKEMSSASIRNEMTTEGPPNPRARMVAISRRAFGNCGIHRVEGAKDSADGHDEWRPVRRGR